MSWPPIRADLADVPWVEMAPTDGALWPAKFALVTKGCLGIFGHAALLDVILVRAEPAGRLGSISCLHEIPHRVCAVISRYRTAQRTHTWRHAASMRLRLTRHDCDLRSSRGTAVDAPATRVLQTEVRIWNGNIMRP